MDTYMVDAWFFPFFLLLHFISFRSFIHQPLRPLRQLPLAPNYFFLLPLLLSLPPCLFEGPCGPFSVFILLWSGDTRLMFLLIPKDTRDGMGLLWNY